MTTKRIATAILWVTVPLLVAAVVGFLGFGIWLLWDVHWIIGAFMALVVIAFGCLAAIAPGSPSLLPPPRLKQTATHKDV